MRTSPVSLAISGHLTTRERTWQTVRAAETVIDKNALQSRFTNRFGVATGLLIATMGFTGLHWSVGSWSPTAIFINGLLLAILMVSTRTLVAPAIAHAAVNTLVLVT